MQLGLNGIDRLPRFEKAYKNLEKRVQDAVDQGIKDLFKDPIPLGRRVRKMNGYRNPDIWEARVGSSYRITFEIKNGIAILRNIGTHAIYSNP